MPTSSQTSAIAMPTVSVLVTARVTTFDPKRPVRIYWNICSSTLRSYMAGLLSSWWSGKPVENKEETSEVKEGEEEKEKEERKEESSENKEASWVSGLEGIRVCNTLPVGIITMTYW